MVQMWETDGENAARFESVSGLSEQPFCSKIEVLLFRR